MEPILKELEELAKTMDDNNPYDKKYKKQLNKIINKLHKLNNDYLHRLSFKH